MKHAILTASLLASGLLAATSAAAGDHGVRYAAPASGPHYELIAPATSVGPARYAYYEHGEGTAPTTMRRSHAPKAARLHGHAHRRHHRRSDRFADGVATGTGRAVGYAIGRAIVSLF